MSTAVETNVMESEFNLFSVDAILSSKSVATKPQKDVQEEKVEELSFDLGFDDEELRKAEEKMGSAQQEVKEEVKEKEAKTTEEVTSVEIEQFKEETLLDVLHNALRSVPNLYYARLEITPNKDVVADIEILEKHKALGGSVYARVAVAKCEGLDDYDTTKTFMERVWAVYDEDLRMWEKTLRIYEKNKNDKKLAGMTQREIYRKIYGGLYLRQIRPNNQH